MKQYYPVKTFDDECFVYERESMSIIPVDYNQYKYILSDANSNRYKELIDELDAAVEENPKGEFISELQPGDRSLTSIVMPITKACNLACPYCFAQSNKSIDNSNDFTYDDIYSIMSFISNSKPNGNYNLIFFGGEPLSRFDIIKKFVEATKLDLKNHTINFSITTNGTLITDNIAEFFFENKFAVLLSLDGLDNKYNHRVFKNGKPSFNKAIKGYDILKSHNVYTEIRATITKDNPYIFETYKYFEDLKNPFTIAFAYDSENVEGNVLSTFMSDDIANISKSLDAVEKYYANKIEQNQPIYNSVLSGFAHKLEFRIRQESVCAGGYTYFTLMHGGRIFSCPHLMDDNRYCMGDIFNFDIIKRKTYNVSAVGVSKIEVCSNCWAKYLCSGGCVSQKISLGRKNSEPLSDERCKLEKLLFTHNLRLYYHLKTKAKSLIQDNSN
jgi:radical SAM protein with 4Fe4S-binding SPASM domain